MAKVPSNWFKYKWPVQFDLKASKADLSDKNSASLLRSFAQILGEDPSNIQFYYSDTVNGGGKTVIWDETNPPCITINRPLKPGTPLFVYEKYAKRSLRLKLFQDNSPAQIEYFQEYDSCSGDPSTPNNPETYDIIADGGVEVGGEVRLSIIETQGGLIVGGESEVLFQYNVMSTGYIEISGQSLIRFIPLGIDGGAICSGESTIRIIGQINVTAFGGIVAGGISKYYNNINKTSILGIEVSGNSIVDVENFSHIKALGGVLISGTAIDTKTSVASQVASGGIVVGGLAFEELIGDGMVNARDIIYNPTGFISRTVEDKLKEEVSVKDFGATGLDSQTDATSYIQNAINYAASSGNFNKTIQFPNGIYNIRGTITIPQGIYLKGEGSQGSTIRYGTVIKHKTNGDCFHFTGGGDPSAGTGGGLEDFLIVKANDGATNYTSGVAVHIEAQSTTNRPGEMLITNVLIYGADTSYWSRCIEVDGTAANTSGTKGIRTINFRKVRVAEASVVNETILFNQATHISSHGLAVDQGTGATAESGITIRGEVNSMFLSGLNMVGSLIVEANVGGNKCNHLHIDGKIQGKINIQDTQVDGTIRVSGLGQTPLSATPVLPGALINRSKLMRITSNYVPYVYAKRNTVFNDVTGGVSGPWYNVAFDSEAEDVYANFDGTTFTCTCAGTYQIDYCITLTEINANHTRFDGGLYWSNGSTPQEFLKVFNPYTTSAGGSLSVSGSHTINMAYGDTANLKIKVLGNAQTVNVYGTSSSQYTWIQIRYIS